VYTLLIWRVLEIGAILTVLALAGFIFSLQRRYSSVPPETGR
jgi:hypothetical protein